MSGAEHHILPTGAWVDLRAGSTLTEGERRPLRSMGNKLKDLAEADQLDAFMEMNDAAAATMISAASFLPAGEKCSVEHVMNLNAADYDALTALVGDRFRAFLDGIDFDPSPDPKALGGPATG